MNYMNDKLMLLGFVSICIPFSGGCVKPNIDTVSGEEQKENEDVGEQTGMNVLFIAVDDLRPELGCYGCDYIHSPNIDNFAKSAIQFNNAFCNIAVSGANRAALITGLYPTRSRFVYASTRADGRYVEYGETDKQDGAPEGTISLPKHLRNNGYNTYSYGKISHNITDFEDDWGGDGPKRFGSNSGVKSYNIDSNAVVESGKSSGAPYESADVEDNMYIDGATIDEAIELLQTTLIDGVKEGGSAPFFFGVGLTKPHLPFNAPSKYWNMYDRNSIELPIPNYYPPSAPSSVDHTSNELAVYSGMPDDLGNKEPLSDDLIRTLKHGYYACVSYTDANIGRLLTALDECGLADNTIVILWGDHGWSLGEHTFWCKHTTFETSLRVPFIVRIPGYAQNCHSSEYTSTVDIYPTICDLLGLPLPAQLEGRSIKDALITPATQSDNAIFCRYQKYEAIIKDGLFFTNILQSRTTPNIVDQMMYDYNVDSAETTNIIDDEAYQTQRNIISAQLESFTNLINQ